MENVNKPQLWNIFNQVTMHSQDVRHHRFCLRLMLKNPDSHALCVLNGHNAFVSGSFKHALGKFWDMTLSGRNSVVLKSLASGSENAWLQTAAPTLQIILPPSASVALPLK